MYRRLGGPHGRSGRHRKYSFHQGFDPRVVQLTVSRCTDYAILDGGRDFRALQTGLETHPSSCRMGAGEVLFLLELDIASLITGIRSFENNSSLDIAILEDEITILCRNVVHESHSDEAPHPKITNIYASLFRLARNV
jgi:hypothetical protein